MGPWRCPSRYPSINLPPVDGREVSTLRVQAASPWMTILVGEAPSATSDPLQPLLGGRSGRFLAELAGLPLHRLGFLFRCVNLLPAPPPDRDKRRRLCAAGARFLPALQGHRVIALGRLVAGALGAGDQPFLEWVDRGLAEVCVLPHPSGESRLWGDEMRQKVSVVLRAEAALVAEGARFDLRSHGVAALPWLDELAGPIL